MSVKVYYADMHTRKHEDSKIAKVGRLCDALGLKNVLGDKAFTAVKLHFGEYGNDSYINPAFVRQVVDKVEQAGSKPFLTDTNTLYGGSRHNAVDHLHTAISHGFAPSVVRAPIIIADGLLGENYVHVPVNLKHFSEVYIGQEIHDAPAMVVLSHFKGHEMAGFGGAIKNLAMGCAAVRGKKAQHSNKVAVDTEKCIACGQCVKVCPEHAATLKKTGEGRPKATVDKSRCIGCYECVTVCEPKAVAPERADDLGDFVERMTEYAFGAIQNKQAHTCYINFVLNVTPDCDCVPWSDAPLVSDLGILASTDPLALDKACFDLVQNAASTTPLQGGGNGVGVDKFTARWTNTFGQTQFTYGQSIGLGSTDYELVRI